ncbi:MAG: hypothetical protein V4537_06145 [Pseudomonadota bacterium]
MAKLPPRASFVTDERVSRSERADAMIAALESRIADDATTRAALLGAVAARGLVEPHRDYHAYALGADQADCELAIGDARALRGLMSVGPAALADLLDGVARNASGMYVTRLWVHLLDTDRPQFERRGAAVDARRLADPKNPSSDQRTVFEASLAKATAAHGHRDQIAYALGADLFACGLFAEDAVAMLGLMSIGPRHLATELREVAGPLPIYVPRLWPELLMRQRDDYEARGSLVRWQRRWARYHVEYEAWVSSARRHDDDWRPSPMTARQRHLVRDTANICGVAIPDQMDRGAAHDWLTAMGANTLFRKEM